MIHTRQEQENKSYLIASSIASRGFGIILIRFCGYFNWTSSNNGPHGARTWKRRNCSTYSFKFIDNRGSVVAKIHFWNFFSRNLHRWWSPGTGTWEITNKFSDSKNPIIDVFKAIKFSLRLAGPNEDCFKRVKVLIRLILDTKKNHFDLLRWTRTRLPNEESFNYWFLESRPYLRTSLVSLWRQAAELKRGYQSS